MSGWDDELDLSSNSNVVHPNVTIYGQHEVTISDYIPRNDPNFLEEIHRKQAINNCLLVTKKTNKIVFFDSKNGLAINDKETLDRDYLIREDVGPYYLAKVSEMNNGKIIIVPMDNLQKFKPFFVIWNIKTFQKESKIYINGNENQPLTNVIQLKNNKFLVSTEENISIYNEFLEFVDMITLENGSKIISFVELENNIFAIASSSKEIIFMDIMTKKIIAKVSDIECGYANCLYYDGNNRLFTGDHNIYVIDTISFKIIKKIPKVGSFHCPTFCRMNEEILLIGYTNDELNWKKEDGCIVELKSDYTIKSKKNYIKGGPCVIAKISEDQYITGDYRSFKLWKFDSEKKE